MQGGTADGDNLSLPVAERILLSVGWSIWLQVYADSIRLSDWWIWRLIRSLQEPALLQRDSQTPVEKQSGSLWALHDKRQAANTPVALKSGMFQRDVDRKRKKKKKNDGGSCHLKCVSLHWGNTHRSHNVATILICVYLFCFFSIVLRGVKCWKLDWLHWILKKIKERKAHVFRGRFTMIITKHSQLHLPHANWWQANQQHAQKTTVPLCWHCCSLAFF